MGADFTKRVKDELKRNGCRFVRQGKGDHEIWENPATKKRFVVDGKVPSRFTANGVMKQASLEKKF